MNFSNNYLKSLQKLLYMIYRTISAAQEDFTQENSHAAEQPFQVSFLFHMPWTFKCHLSCTYTKPWIFSQKPFNILILYTCLLDNWTQSVIFRYVEPSLYWFHNGENCQVFMIISMQSKILLNRCKNTRVTSWSIHKLNTFEALKRSQDIFLCRLKYFRREAAEDGNTCT